jgi:hypothetical protein
MPDMTQCERVLDYMREFGSITPLDAMQDLGCMRLAPRIADLRDQGYAIGRRMKSRKNRYGKSVSFAEYYLEEEKHEQC